MLTLLTPTVTRAVERGCKKPTFLGLFLQKKPKNLKSPNVIFFRKTLKIQILDSQPQQKNCCLPV